MNLSARNRTTGWWRRLARGGLQGGMALMLSVLLPAQSVALAAAPNVPPASAGGSPGKGQAATAASRWPSSKDANAAAKVSKQVNDAFTSASKQVTYLVQLHAKADVSGTAAAARKMATPAAGDLQARSAVIRTLRQTAEQSQAGLMSTLEAARKKGQVSKVESFWVANIVAVTSTQGVMQELAKRPDVAKIMPNAEMKLIKATPAEASAPKAAAQPKAGPVKAAADPTIQSLEWGIARVGAQMVWNTYGINGTGTVVAGMDTGVDWNHPALHDRWRGYDPATGTTDSTYSWFDAVNGQSMPYDDHGHGTHTMGSAVGGDPTGVNEIGVAPGARWIGVKILSGSGSGSAENILRAAEWLLAPGGDPSKAPDVVNNSWGGGPGVDDWMRDVVRAWRAAGIAPVFAAGNDGPGDGSVSNPGNYPETIAVGAIDRNDNLAGFSGRGPSPYGVMKPQVSAPGVSVRSSIPGGGYGSSDGTSMAAPHVAGAVALLRQADASLTVDEIEEILKASADAKSDSRYPAVPNNGWGHGILNVFTAVAMVVDGVGSISGRVVTGGDDWEAPVVRHTPVTESYKGVPIEISADIMDNVSVIDAQLRFRMPGMRWWGTVDMTRASGDHREGTYKGTIAGEMTHGTAVEYYIQATDYGGNTAGSGSASRPHSVPLLNGITPGYMQDFEGAAAGWSHGGQADTWAIGEPTSGPGSAHSGTRVAATNLSGPYADGSESWLMSPPIDLSGGGASLRFHHWFETEPGWDYGFVIASGNGGETWDILQEYTGASTNWQEVTLDLSAYAGSSAAFVAFYFSSDGSITAPGWYVDDVEIFVDDQPPAVPADLSATATATGAIALSWSAVTASDLAGYKVYRSTQSGSDYQPVADVAQPGYLDTDTAGGTTYYYVVTAHDMMGNESAYSTEASATAASGTTVFTDDMESGDGSWTTTGTAWQRGTPTSGPGAAHSGSNVWATNLGGDYDNNTNASLISPPLDLAGLSTVNLQFAHWYHLERNWDIGRIEVSEDGGTTWSALITYNAPTGSPPVGWEEPIIDISAYAGRTIQLRFRLESDSSVTYPGWYIDDVRVAGLTTAGTRVNMTLGFKSLEVEPRSVKGKGIQPSEVKIRMPKAQSGNTVQPNQNTAKSGGVKASTIGVMALPLEATVTVVESGLVVRTDPARGTFNMILPAGTFTLRAEAYGYFPQERQVTVEPDSNTSAIFVLNPIPRGQIQGTITDARSGNPIAGARVAVAEDMRVAPVMTGADGRYSLDVLEGQYTVEVRYPGYYPASAPASVPGNGSVTVDMGLEPFIGMPGEIAYDDGSAENAWALFAGGNGWAVRMSPATPGQSMMIRGGRFYHWDASWPAPGGNTFQVAIFSANADGSPGRLLAGPVRVTDAVRGGWTDVDLSHLGVTVSGDFYMVHIQDVDYPAVPGLATDDTTRQTGRNWQYVAGNFVQWEEGNFMIRALVDYEVSAPAITSPADGAFTNNPALTVTGTANTGVNVSVAMDGAEAASTQAGTDGSWSAGLTLTEGEHALTATAVVDGRGTTRPSAPVRVTLDTMAPSLTIAAPTDGQSQNSRILAVSGNVEDTNLHEVMVNGSRVTVGADGSFMTELVGTEGQNTITVAATDRAGNRTEMVRTVMVDASGPSISNLQPGSAMTLMTGDSLVIAFDAEPGLVLAAFQIAVGSGASSSTGKATSMTLQPGEAALSEVSPGHYEARWTLPDGMSAPAAYVQVRAVDAAGNEARATAPGVLQLVDNDRPTAVIAAPTTGRVGRGVSFDGRGSTDLDGRIVSHLWNWGDGTANSTGNRMSHTFSTAGTFQVTLTVTDDKGGTSTATHTITIRN